MKSLNLSTFPVLTRVAGPWANNDYNGQRGDDWSASPENHFPSARLDTRFILDYIVSAHASSAFEISLRLTVALILTQQLSKGFRNCVFLFSTAFHVCQFQF